MFQNTILIDGLQTLKNKFNYTVKDEIFRFLSSKIDEKFQIIILTFSSEEETEAFEIFPECMFKNIIFYNRNMGIEMIKTLNKEESIILTNTNEATLYFKVFGFQQVYEIRSFIKNTVDYPIIDMVDFIFAFGFSEKNFIQFCKENNSRGIINSQIVYNIDYPTTLTFWVDSSKDYNLSYEEFNIFSIKQISSGEYELKREGNIMAVVYQGNDEILAIKSELPILYI
jgi:hypothetical protein